MGSFLSRLAGRTLGLVAVAEPIIPARLTPPAREDARPREFSADDATRGERQAARAGLRDDTQEAQPRLPLRTRRDSLAETDAGSQEHVRSTRQRDTVPPHAEAFRSEPAPERAEEKTQRRAVGFERPKNDAQALSVSREVETRPARPRVQPLEPMRARTLASRARMPAPEAANDETPRIQVSIGRIEIRAEVAAPAAPAPRRSRPATLSLSDYLRQQGEAGR